jgi:hypothetical protein
MTKYIIFQPKKKKKIYIFIFGTDFVVYCGEWFWKKYEKKNH